VSFFLSDEALYGEAVEGGARGTGVVFRFQP
jgi:hypothetical protein